VSRHRQVYQQQDRGDVGGGRRRTASPSAADLHCWSGQLTSVSIADQEAELHTVRRVSTDRPVAGELQAPLLCFPNRAGRTGYGVRPGSQAACYLGAGVGAGLDV
jgi:hypothetical protein